MRYLDLYFPRHGSQGSGVSDLAIIEAHRFRERPAPEVDSDA